MGYGRENKEKLSSFPTLRVVAGNNVSNSRSFFSPGRISAEREMDSADGNIHNARF